MSSSFDEAEFKRLKAEDEARAKKKAETIKRQNDTRKRNREAKANEINAKMARLESLEAENARLKAETAEQLEYIALVEAEKDQCEVNQLDGDDIADLMDFEEA
jgi:chromosome segregation ATPase